MADWSVWVRWFEDNGARPWPAIDGGERWGPALRARVAETLATLQAGETGEGRIAHEVHKHDVGDPAWRACLPPFLAEEGQHALHLGRCLKHVGGAPRLDAPAARLFTTARRAIGPRTKLTVLFAAEVVAIGLYEGLADAIGPSGLADTLLRIRDDEVAHLAFHATFFHERVADDPLRRAAFVAAWRAGTRLAAVAALADHGPTLAALGGDPAAVRRRMAACAAHAETLVLHGVPPWTAQVVDQAGRAVG